MKHRIRFLRVERGWTQQALANRVGITRMMISLFEHWRHDPSLALAYRFADAFEKRIDDVFPTNRKLSHRRSQKQRHPNWSFPQSKQSARGKTKSAPYEPPNAGPKENWRNAWASPRAP